MQLHKSALPQSWVKGRVELCNQAKLDGITAHQSTHFLEISLLHNKGLFPHILQKAYYENVRRQYDEEEYGIVLTTFENEQQAKPVIDEIMRCKLAVCIQEIKIISHYTWNVELCHEDEVLVLLKTRKDLYPELEKKTFGASPV